MGIGIPFLSTFLKSCGKSDDLHNDFEVNFRGKVIIIGAGAAGLTAGYLLRSCNIEFEILEAASVFGGRVKRAADFADFPIDLGAEWIHEDPSVLATLLSDPQKQVDTEVITYNPKTIYSYNNGKLQKQNWVSHFYSEHKFKNTTWYGFLEKYLVPGIADTIVYNSPVKQIDYSAAAVSVKTIDDATFQADRVLVTVPVKILQANAIEFVPGLPADKAKTINGIVVPDGIKVFMEFSERFYPDMLYTERLSGAIDDSAGERVYYDAAFGKNSPRNILALFCVGNRARAYTELETDTEIIEKILGELDEIFAGMASRTYKKHVVQNWSREPYIQGAYGIDSPESPSEIADTLLKPVDTKLYFAGSAAGGEERASTVPGAVESAYKAIKALLQAL